MAKCIELEAQVEIQNGTLLGDEKKQNPQKNQESEEKE